MITIKRKDEFNVYEDAASGLSIQTALINLILDRIPSNLKPVDYLVGILGISRESVYRRLQGTNEFKFSEISKLSSALNFSIDELMGHKNSNFAVFGILPDVRFCSESVFFKMLEDYLLFLLQATKCENSNLIITLNRLLPIDAIGYDAILKFFYFKWKHQATSSLSSIESFSDTVFSQKHLQLIDRLKQYHFSMNKTVIMDPDMLTNSLNEVVYYYKRKLITKEEMLSVIDEFQLFVNHLERLAAKGKFVSGKKANIYLSTLSIESNTIYYEIDGNVHKSFFMINYVSPISTDEELINASHKEWINSLKKYSTFITQSNEIDQADFFSSQHKLIEDTKTNL